MHDDTEPKTLAATPAPTRGETLETSRRDDSRDAESRGTAFSEILKLVAAAPPRRPPPERARVGDLWAGRYTIQERLGSGGMGTVYAAFDETLRRRIALKVLDAAAGDDIAARKGRLLQEASIAAGIQHARVARVYDVNEHEGVLFVAMELVPGQTLRRWMTGRQVPGGEILTVAQEIAEGLAELHEKGVFHRDLKPENVMVTDKDGIRLLDFGLARQAAREGAAVEDSTPVAVSTDGSSSAYSGTPGYMAPEQWAGETLDARVDVFALGVIVYELVTGARPFVGEEPAAVLEATLCATPDFAGEGWARVPPGLGAITARMLSPKPADRFAGGVEVLDALRALSADRVVVVPRAVAKDIEELVTRVAPTPPRRWARTWTSIGVAAAVGGSLLVGAVAVLHGGHPAVAPMAASLAPRPGMALIDVGTITVGHSPEELDRECAAIGPGCDRERMQREVPSARVAVPRFLLDVYEVTNQEMAAVLQDYGGSLFVAEDEDDHYPRYVRWNKDLGHDGEILADLHALYGGIEYRADRSFHARAGRERWPATQVTWYGARLYCQARDKVLPTENEWEAAARGREDRPYPWGKDEVRCGQVVVPRDGLVRMPAECPETVSLGPVGQAAQDVTPEGVHDLGGNAAEWVDAVFTAGSRIAPADAGAADLPKVLRGGSFAESFMVRTSGRGRRPAAAVGDNLAFRCAVR